MGMGDGTFPDYRSLQGKPLEEERNNAYVAVTRAKRRLYISYPERKNVPWGTKDQKISRFFASFEITPPPFINYPFNEEQYLTEVGESKK